MGDQQSTYGQAGRRAQRLSFLLCLSVSFLGCGDIREPLGSPTPVGSPSPAPRSQLKFAYVENDFSNSISMFKVSASGLWTPNSPASIPVGNHPESLVVHPSGHFVYVPTIADGIISMFSVDPATGLLAPLTPATVPTGSFPQWMALDPQGRFAYTSNTRDNTVSMFVVNQATGVLTPTTPAAVPTGTEAQTQQPTGLAVDPKGRFVFVSDASGVSSFTINQTTGVLSATSPAAVRNLGAPFPPTVDPGGRFLYVPDTVLNRVWVFAIDQTSGALSPAATPFVAVDFGPTAVAFDAAGRFGYVVNRSSETISQFALNGTTGSLQPLAPPTFASKGEPWQVLVDPSGQLAYVSQESTNLVSIYSIGSNGTLSAFGTAATQLNPGGIGVVTVPPSP